MSNPLTVNSVYSLLSNLEQAALKSADAHVQAFGASMSNTLTAFRAAVPGLAAAFVNAGIAELARAEPVFGLLIPAEAIIDPAVSGLAASLEGMLLNGAGAGATPVAVTAEGQTRPQAE
jgi:hypothetical protein